MASKATGSTKLTALHERMADHMNDLINNRVTIPVWMMTTGRTMLCQKDQERGSAVDNYRDPYPVYHLFGN